MPQEFPRLLTFLASALADAATSSGVDVLVPGMTLTPGPGTYIVYFWSSGGTNANAATGSLSVYNGGVQVAASEVRIRGRAVDQVPISAGALITVLPGDAVEIRFRIDLIIDVLTLHQRTLLLLKVA